MRQRIADNRAPIPPFDDVKFNVPRQDRIPQSRPFQPPTVFCQSKRLISLADMLTAQLTEFRDVSNARISTSRKQATRTSTHDRHAEMTVFPRLNTMRIVCILEQMSAGRKTRNVETRRVRRRAADKFYRTMETMRSARCTTRKKKIFYRRVCLKCKRNVKEKRKKEKREKGSRIFNIA